MAEPFDVYIDQFVVTLGVFGAALNFRLSSTRPVLPGSMPEAQDVGVVRMSLEHLKSMVFILKRQIDQFEQQAGVSIPIPIRALSQFQIAPEDWEKFWSRE